MLAGGKNNKRPKTVVWHKVEPSRSSIKHKDRLKAHLRTPSIPTPPLPAKTAVARAGYTVTLLMYSAENMPVSTVKGILMVTAQSATYTPPI